MKNSTANTSKNKEGVEKWRIERQYLHRCWTKINSDSIYESTVIDLVYLHS